MEWRPGAGLKIEIKSNHMEFGVLGHFKRLNGGPDWGDLEEVLRRGGLWEKARTKLR